MLAGKFEEQWDREAGLRQLYQPVPLQVRWSSTGRPVAASRDVVFGDNSDADWRQLPLQGDADEVVAAFRRLPYRQLVVLGEAGAGKSVLAMLLTLRLLKDPEPGQQVPMLLPIASWNPAQESLQDFLVRRLGEDYPSLAEHGEDGQTLARLLAARRRILPVLDGLDELPTGMLPRAVQALDTYAAPDRPLVVTCRSREYEQAVRKSGTVLSRSAVVEIEPVTTRKAIEFLSHPAPSRLRWQPVFDHLREHPDSRLARTLSTPLMVALARGAYRSPDSNPADLLSLDNDAAVTGSLMDGFVKSVYRNDQPGRRIFWPRRSGDYDASDAARWLSCLAYHLYQAGTRDLWWWQLRPWFLSPRPRRVKRSIPAAYTMAAAAGAFAIGQTRGLWPAIWAAVTGALTVAVSAAGLLRPMWPAGYPLYLPTRYRPPRQRRILNMGIRAAFGSIFGLAAGLLAGSALLGLVGGLTAGLAAAVIPAMRVRTTRWQSTPRMTLRLNRRTVVYAALQYGLTGGVIFAVLARFTANPGSAFAAGCTATLIYALAAACGAGGWTWILFRTTHVRLAIQDRLPWRLWTFLEDAHFRGTLRQAGTSWQFRHALLQDHLARTIYFDHLQARADAGDWSAAWRLADLLVAEGRVDELRARADAGDQIAARRLADLLATEGRVDEAIAVIRPLADFGEGDAAWRLADLLVAEGRVDELRARADAGDQIAARRLADLLATEGRVDEAIAVIRPLADAGDKDAERRLADLLATEGRVDEAIALLLARAADVDRRAASQLADLLAREGRVDELRVRADSGDHDAAERLADLLIREGRVDELRVRADAGDWAAVWRLADLLIREGRVDELRARADAGDRYAAGRLADLLAREGRIDEAIAVIRPLADFGEGDAAWRLADLLVAEGRVDELRVRANAGDQIAARRLADLLAREGQVDEAIALLRAGVGANDWRAASQLAELLAREGRIDEAIAIIRPLAATAPPNAANQLADPLSEPVGQLADLLAKAGRIDELRARARAGDWAAAWRLADLLAEDGRVDEAIALLRARAAANDWRATRQLADLLVREGRVDELRARADAGDFAAENRLADLLVREGRVDELRARADAGNQAAARRLADLSGSSWDDGPVWS